MRFVVALKKLRIQTDYRYGLTVCYQISIDPGKRGILNYKEFLIMSKFFSTLINHYYITTQSYLKMLRYVALVFLCKRCKQQNKALRIDDPTILPFFTVLCAFFLK